MVVERVYITKIAIDHVRHLRDIEIPISSDSLKHLILTGKNGSGKTSLLEALANYLNEMMPQEYSNLSQRLSAYYNAIAQISKDYRTIEKLEEDFRSGLREIHELDLDVNIPFYHLRDCMGKGEVILAYYPAERLFEADIPQHVEKVELKDSYLMKERPRQLFIKYLVDLKVMEALFRNGKKTEKADRIREWFIEFQELLRKIFEDDSLELIFDEESFVFTIQEKDREPFDFNALSSGYGAVLDIVSDLMVRMEKKTERSFRYDLPGIVLIDEIETHLHLDMQKNILSFLTMIFPNIQFIVSTHSPFVLNSLENAVIYDLEKNIVVENGLSNVPYSGIVEGYFHVDELSANLKEKFRRYQALVKKAELSDDDFEEIADLEMYLNEIPDYLALELTTEYQKLKLDFANRGDL